MNSWFDKPETTEKTPNPWPAGGYAPGGYTCTCTTCDAAYLGEKRSFQCLHCGVQHLKTLAAPSQVEERAMKKMIKEKVIDNMIEILKRQV